MVSDSISMIWNTESQICLVMVFVNILGLLNRKLYVLKMAWWIIVEVSSLDEFLVVVDLCVNMVLVIAIHAANREGLD